MSPAYFTVFCVFSVIIREEVCCSPGDSSVGSVVTVWPVPITAVPCAYVGILGNNWKNNLVMHMN